MLYNYRYSSDCAGNIDISLWEFNCVDAGKVAGIKVGIGVWILSGNLALEQSVVNPQLLTYTNTMNSNKSTGNTKMSINIDVEKSRFMDPSPNILSPSN